jgi:hypothetical protein
MNTMSQCALALTLATAATAAAAQTCFPVGVSFTVFGRAGVERVSLSDGSASKIAVLTMDPPLCVIDKRYSNDPQGRISVTRMQLVNASPPLDVPLMVTGTLVTRNAPEYFFLPSSISVVPPTMRIPPAR